MDVSRPTPSPKGFKLMSLPVTTEVAKELEQNHGFELEHEVDTVHYYRVFPNAR